MAALTLSVIILLIFFDPSQVYSAPFNTYCSLPCPLMTPTPSPWVPDCNYCPDCNACNACNSCNSNGSYPRLRPRVSNSDSNTEDENSPEKRPARSREQPEDKPSPASKETPTPAPPHRRPMPISNSEPSDPSVTVKTPERQDWERPRKFSCPQRRFFASLCSIPGAVVDTMLSGEVVL